MTFAQKYMLLVSQCLLYEESLLVSVALSTNISKKLLFMYIASRLT